MSNQPSATLIAAPAHPSAAILAAYLIAEHNSSIITAEELNCILQTPIEGLEIIALFKEDKRDFFRSLGYTGDMREILKEFKNDAYRYLARLVKQNHRLLDCIALTFVITHSGETGVAMCSLQQLIANGRDPEAKSNPVGMELNRQMTECLRELDPHLHSLIVD